MKKQLDMEKLIQEVMGFSGNDDSKKKIDQSAMDLLDSMQQYIDLVRKHIHGDLPIEVAEPRVNEVLTKIERLKGSKSYWWLNKK